MARTTDYDGRRVSISIYDQMFNYQSTVDQAVPTTLNGEQGGFVCTGIVKLCQSVLVFLLSDDVIFDSTWGSAIPRYMTGSLQHFASNLEIMMTSAFAETIRELKFNQREDAPLDEQIQDISLQDWDYMDNGTGITTRILVTSAAGEQRDLVVPINLTI